MVQIAFLSIWLTLFSISDPRSDDLDTTRRLLEEGEVGQALEVLQGRLDTTPEDSEAWLLMGQGCMHLVETSLAEDGDPTLFLMDAKQAFARCMELHPGHPDAVHGTMNALYWLSDWDALEALAFRETGRALLQKGNIPSWLMVGLAQARVKKVQGSNPKSAAESADILIQGLELTRNGQKQVPGQPLLVAAECDLLQWAGFYSMAVDRLGAALQEMPSTPDLHRRFIDLYYYSQTVDRLPGFYAELGKKAPDDPAVAWYRGYSELLAGDLARKEMRLADARMHYNESRNGLMQAATADPAWDDTTRHYAFIAELGLGWCALREEDFKLAADIMLDLLNTAPDLREEPDGLGRTLLDAVGRFEAEVIQEQQFAIALPLARRVAEVIGSEAVWYNNLGFMLREYGSSFAGSDAYNPEKLDDKTRKIFQESWEAYLKAAACDPDNPRIVNDAALIQAYHLHTDLDKAEEMLHHAIKVGNEQIAALGDDPPEDERFFLALAVGDAWQNLGHIAHNVEGDLEKARKFYNKSLASNSGPRPGVRIALDATTRKDEPRQEENSGGQQASGQAQAQTRQRALQVSMKTHLTWEPSFEEAMSRAERENRSLFVYYRPAGLADAVPYLDRLISMPAFAKRVEGVVCVIADKQRYTYKDRRGDGRPLFSLRYGEVTSGEHIKSAEEFLSFWQENRDENAPLYPDEDFYYFTPDGKRFIPENVSNYRELFDSMREKAGEPESGVDLNLLEEQIKGHLAPQRTAAAEFLVDTGGRSAQNLLEKLLFDPETPAAGRTAIIQALAGRDDEESKSLLEALVRQCADPELTTLALKAWPAKGGCTPLVFALNWSDCPEVRAAAMAAIARSDHGDAEQRMLAARLVAGEEETRAAAATALGLIRDDCMDLMLIHLDADPSGTVRAALCDALAGVASDQARRLLDKLRGSDPDPRVRVAAAIALDG